MSLKSAIQTFTEKWKEGKEQVVYPVADRLYRHLVYKENYSLLDDRPTDSKGQVSHIAYFARSNAGDILLPVMLRDLFESQIGRLSWRKQHVHKDVDSSALRGLNRGKGIIIGGGGLFLKDTNPNNLSGWQWSCSLDMLNKIDQPIALFAVGYNRFRGQGDFSELFREHVTKVAEKSVLIGLRNYGSINQVKNYLPEELHHKLRFQPCMTTLGTRIYGAKAARQADTPPFISINCAFDRSHLRYGEKVGSILEELALACKQLSEKVAIKYYAHTVADEHFLPFLDGFGVPYELVKLYRIHPKNVLEAYRQPLVALGMRGHAQLIPFGCGRPIVSLITHNKLKYFLDDIELPEWGVELHKPDFGNALVSQVHSMLDNMEAAEQSVHEKQEGLWKATLDNLNEIKQAFKL